MASSFTRRVSLIFSRYIAAKLFNVKSEGCGFQFMTVNRCREDGRKMVRAQFCGAYNAYAIQVHTVIGNTDKGSSSKR
jgi:hypothetical protein